MVSLAWLLHNRELLPKKRHGTFIDTGRVVAGIGNRVVVKWLGTWKNSLTAEALLKNHLKNIWDDRVLNHAVKIWGGIPDILLENVRNTVPENIMDKLGRMVLPTGEGARPVPDR
jgi:hypothetical protein